MMKCQLLGAEPEAPLQVLRIPFSPGAATFAHETGRVVELDQLNRRGDAAGGLAPPTSLRARNKG